MPMIKSTEVTRKLIEKHCPECGGKMEAKVKTYIQECDRCLSKREE